MQAPLKDPGGNVGIDWQYGGLDQVFARARAEKRPVFLFWSSDWCPDSAQVRAAILSRPGLAHCMRQLLAVHLDGDADQAQQLGERLGVSSYPTMVIFDSDGTEITRLPVELGLSQFCRVLDSALAVMTPAPDLIGKLLSGTSTRLGEDEWRMLAGYRWEQNRQRALAGRDPVSTFADLARLCPDKLPIERSRLYVAHVQAMIDSGDLSGNDMQLAADRLIALLADPDMCRANLDMILNRPGQITARLTRAGSPLRRALETAWRKSLDALEDTGSLSATEHVYITRARIRLLRVDDAGTNLPLALQEQVLVMADWVDANTRGYERLSAVNAAANTLTEAGLFAQATSLLSRELATASSTFYFMNKLAIVASRAGQTEKALEWLERAHAGARGSATRFQWGVNLVTGLVDMAPDRADVIEQTAVTLISELGETADPLYNRNVTRLEQLDSKLRQWNEDNVHAQGLQSIRAALTGVCDSLQKNQAVPVICREFLAE